jgi:hypothetical protein
MEDLWELALLMEQE